MNLQPISDKGRQTIINAGGNPADFAGYDPATSSFVSHAELRAAQDKSSALAPSNPYMAAVAEPVLRAGADIYRASRRVPELLGQMVLGKEAGTAVASTMPSAILNRQIEDMLSRGARGAAQFRQPGKADTVLSTAAGLTSAIAPYFVNPMVGLTTSAMQGAGAGSEKAEAMGATPGQELANMTMRAGASAALDRIGMLGAAKTAWALAPMARLARRGAIEGAATQGSFNVADKVTFNPNQDLSEGVATSALIGGFAPVALRGAGEGLAHLQGPRPPVMQTPTTGEIIGKIHRTPYEDAVKLFEQAKAQGLIRPDVTFDKIGGPLGNRMSRESMDELFNLMVRGEKVPMGGPQVDVLAEAVRGGLIRKDSPTFYDDIRAVLNYGPAALGNIYAREVGTVASEKRKAAEMAQQASNQTKIAQGEAARQSAVDEAMAKANADRLKLAEQTGQQNQKVANAAALQSLENQAKIEAGQLKLRQIEAEQQAAINKTANEQMKNVRAVSESGMEAMLEGSPAQAVEKQAMIEAAKPQAAQQAAAAVGQNVATRVPAPETIVTGEAAKAPIPVAKKEDIVTAKNAVTAATTAPTVPAVGKDAAIKPGAPSQEGTGPKPVAQSAPAPASVPLKPAEPSAPTSALRVPEGVSKNPSAAEVTAAAGAKETTPVSAPPVTSALPRVPADVAENVQRVVWDLYNRDRGNPLRGELIQLARDVEAGVKPLSALTSALPKSEVASPVATVKAEPAKMTDAPKLTDAEKAQPAAELQAEMGGKKPRAKKSAPAPLKIKTQAADPVAADKSLLDQVGLVVRKKPDGNYELYNKEIDEVVRQLGGAASEAEAIGEAARSMREGNKPGGMGSKMTGGRRSEAGMINVSLIADKMGELFDNTKKKIDSGYMLGRLRNMVVAGKIPTIEMQIYEQNGLNEFLTTPRTPEELSQWMKENGPRVTVLDYGMTGKESEARQELNKLTHEWLDNLDGGSAQLVRRAEAARVGYGLDSDFVDKHLAYLSGENYRKAKRFLELKEAVEYETPDNAPRATSYYKQISAHDTGAPMPEWTVSKLPNNVQRVDVAIPQKEISYNEWLQRYEREDNATNREIWKEKTGSEEGKVKSSAIWEPDNLHENVPNTLGWAMIQYTTGPKGEKVAHIVESQSRWGQERRKAEQRAEKYPGVNPDLDVQPHPLLSDYNRLILKAAIDQARKEGATHIAISDAETAMMTEMHDQHATPPLYKPEEVGKFGVFQPNSHHGGKAFDTLAEAQALADRQNEWYRTELNRPNAMTARQITEADVRPVIDQEGGMRFNYDQQLPKIASEMLGPGERVSLGEHKNAVERMSDAPHRRIDEFGPSGTAPRPNLIFRNPDGTPKTDASGMMFKLPDYEPQFSVAGKDRGAAAPKIKLTPPGQGLGSKMRPSTGEEGFVLNPGKAVVDLAKRVPKYVRSAVDMLGDWAQRTNSTEGKYAHGKFNELATGAAVAGQRSINQNQQHWTKLSTAERNKLTEILQYERAYESDWPGAMPARVEAAYNEVRAHMNELGDRTVREGPYINDKGVMRPLEKNQYWIPEAYSQKIIKELADDTKTSNGKSVRENRLEEYRDWMRQHGASEAEIDAEIKLFDFEGRTGDADVEFDPLHKPAKIPLPPGWAGNTQEAINRYLARYEFDMLRHKLIDQDPLLGPISSGQRESLDERGQPRVRPFEAGQVGDDLDSLVRGALNSFAFQYNPGKRTALAKVSSVANSMAVQTGATIRDALMMASPLIDDAGVVNSLRGLVDGMTRYRDLKARGLVRDTGNFSGEFQRFAEAWDNKSVSGMAHEAMRMINRGTGVDALNKWMQAVSAAAGVARAKEAIARGDDAFFRKVGLPDWRTRAPGDVEDFVARWVVEGSQGTQGAKGLPVHMLKASGGGSQFTPILRWSYDFTNQQINRAWKPLFDSNLTAAQRIKPLATRLAGAAGASALTATLLNTMLGREDRNISYKEWEAAGYPNKLKYLMQKASDLQVLPLVTAFGNVFTGGQQLPRNLGMEILPQIRDKIATMQELKREFSEEDFKTALDGIMDTAMSNWRDVSKVVSGEQKDPVEQARARYENMNTAVRPAALANPLNLTAQFNDAKTAAEALALAKRIVETATLETPDVSVRGPSEDAAFDKWLEKTHPDLSKQYRLDNMTKAQGLDTVYEVKRALAESVNAALEKKRAMLMSKEPNEVKRAQGVKIDWKSGGYKMK